MTMVDGDDRSVHSVTQTYDRMRIPTLQDVYLARNVIAPFLAPTPLLRSAVLSEKLEADIYLKCENLQPIGAFKIRGGVNLMANLGPAERAAGVVTASTGNHGQSIAFAAGKFGVNATVFMPERANPIKVRSMERLGATVVFDGEDFDACRLAAETFANATGAYFVHSANETHLIAGVGTYSLEIMEAIPDLEMLIVPIGAGSGACGAVVAGKSINPDLKVIGVQAAGAPVFRDSWLQRTLLAYDKMETFAEGMATRVAFELPADILFDGIDDIELVSDQEIGQAILTLLESDRMLAEGAGAASVAAAKHLRDAGDLRGKKVALVISGGNLTIDTLQDVMAKERAW